VDDASTLQLYRRALSARRELQSGETLEWVTRTPTVVAFARPGGWTSVTNFGTAPVPLPPGRVVVASAPVEGTALPGETTVWLQDDAS
jgi:alpha-glucosidase